MHGHVRLRLRQHGNRIGAMQLPVADYGTSLEFLIGEVNLESGCNGGYAVAESLPISLVNTETGMAWFIADDVAQILSDNGFGPVVADLNNQTLSLCGSSMNVVDVAGNAYALTYDSLGYINPFYNGYLAPAENFGYGCGFEFACNYDPCAIYDFELCEFLEVSVETTTDDGAAMDRPPPPWKVAWNPTRTHGSKA